VSNPSENFSAKVQKRLIFSIIKKQLLHEKINFCKTSLCNNLLFYGGKKWSVSTISLQLL